MLPSLGRILGIIIFIYSSLSPVQAASKGVVKLVYVEWSSEVVSTNIVKALLEQAGYEVQITATNTLGMWQSVANGTADATVGAWLDNTQGQYLNLFGDKIESLGANLEGTRVGLVVPEYVNINSIEELNANIDKFGGKIIGIDPGAGVMGRTVQARHAYALKNYHLALSSEVAMTQALSDAVDTKRWIVVTGWVPHWMFLRWKLKFLKDPKKVYDYNGFIATVVRKGLAQQQPEVYRILDNFYWSVEEMQKVMFWNVENYADPYKTAQRWLKENPERVKQWLEPKLVK
ncbi:MAG: glycine betaine ABC transporter substrate-binding protein [Thiotrichaceae bacterium]|nr:glycine betaine ABC transporter substrate-binding protein [Thiotrichaceae bacterium]